MAFKVRRAALLSLTLSQLVGCGTIFYPERDGQASGDIDPVVAALDAAGLAFYVFPGLIALGIDLSTGAIYEPDPAYPVSREATDTIKDSDTYTQGQTIGKPDLSREVGVGTGSDMRGNAQQSQRSKKMEADSTDDEAGREMGISNKQMDQKYGRSVQPMMPTQIPPERPYSMKALPNQQERPTWDKDWNTGDRLPEGYDGVVPKGRNSP